MPISTERLEEFKALWINTFGEAPSDEELVTAATHLVRFYEIITRPIEDRCPSCAHALQTGDTPQEHTH